MTKVSLIVIELNSSRGTVSSIAIQLKNDGQRELIILVVFYTDFVSFES